MIRSPALISSIALVLAATAAIAQQPDMRVNVLVVESVEDFQRWLTQEPAPQGPYPPSLKEIPVGKRVHFPILVQGIRAPAQGVVTLVADVEFFGPDGKSLAAAPQCCRYTITNAPDIRMAVLGPTMNLALESGDKRGDYTVRVSVTDGTQRVAAIQTFQFVSEKSATPPPAPAPPAAPRLRMDDPPARKPGLDADKRDCLSLPTPSEIIKCTEQKRSRN
jgi:hypothetical protein